MEMRDCFFERFYELGSKDSNIIMLAADFDAFGLRKFKEEFPDRFINVGVSEQNMINLASGLAIRGKKVFCYSIASFMTTRCFEQIKLNLCVLNLPVTLIGGGVGLSFGGDGISHHAIQDIAIMRTLPEMEIICCSDINTTKYAADYAVQLRNTPLYVRLDKGNYPSFPLSKEEAHQGFRELLPTAPVTIVASGYMLTVAEKVASTFQNIGLIDCFKINSSSANKLAKKIGNCKQIIVMEENAKSGAIWTLLAEGLVSTPNKAIVSQLSLPDAHILKYGKREWFHKIFNIAESNLKELLETALKG